MSWRRTGKSCHEWHNWHDWLIIFFLGEHIYEDVSSDWRNWFLWAQSQVVTRHLDYWTRPKDSFETWKRRTRNRGHRKSSWFENRDSFSEDWISCQRRQDFQVWAMNCLKRTGLEVLANQVQGSHRLLLLLHLRLETIRTSWWWAVILLTSWTLLLTRLLLQWMTPWLMAWLTQETTTHRLLLSVSRLGTDDHHWLRLQLPIHVCLFFPVDYCPSSWVMTAFLFRQHSLDNKRRRPVNFKFKSLEKMSFRIFSLLLLTIIIHINIYYSI